MSREEEWRQSRPSTSSSSTNERDRIYWQQWTNPTSRGSSSSLSRRELLTSSTAVRISSMAQAQDVTQFLRQTLADKLGTPTATPPNSSSSTTSMASFTTPTPPPPPPQDKLVLVGTLYSLPKDYIQFERYYNRKLRENNHKNSHHHTHEQDHNNSMNDDSYYYTLQQQHAPFHLIQTLQPTDHPWKMRQCMQERIENYSKMSLMNEHNMLQQQQHRTIISPKLQWFYVPDTTKETIPNCIELDGYATTLEDDDEDTDSPVHHPSREDDFSPRESLQLESKLTMLFPDRFQDQMQVSTAKNQHHFQRAQREARKKSELQSLLNNSPSSILFTGFLMKQSTKDPHVWRRVHCILTHESLWYVTRIYSFYENQTEHCKYAKHFRIKLSDALLLEATDDYSPLYRIPYAFELVSGAGKSYIFRANNHKVVAQWTIRISEQIVEAFENSLMDQAQLLISDETKARNRRIENAMQESIMGHSSSHRSTAVLDAETQLRLFLLGIKVVSYQERCRYIKSVLPLKGPVVVNSANGSMGRETQVYDLPALSAQAREMIQTAWDEANGIFDWASANILGKLSSSDEDSSRHTRALGIHFRYVQQILSSRETSVSSKNTELPPMDLFDLLLSELKKP